MIPAVTKLTVCHNEDLVGVLQLSANDNSCVFEYASDWLRTGFSLSPLELPLHSGLHYADANKFGGNFAVFEDSMPDGYGLYLIDRMLRRNGTSLSQLTHLQRLAIVGMSGMGAIKYKPFIDLHETKTSIVESELDEIQRMVLDILTEKNSGDESLLYYNSANSGGARPKIAMQDSEGKHWIVKFRHTYDAVSVGREEYLYMKTARECGINIPNIKLINDKYFAIERFDIEQGKGVHVLTAAALLKSDFRNQTIDYTNLLALTGFLTQNPQEVEEMYRRMVYNVVCENRDDHAKNFSFICRNGMWTLSPAYDITYSPIGTKGEHATSLFYNGNPTKDLMIKAGVQIKIPKKRCLEIIDCIEKICNEKLR
ncbi:MAG: type II toxin-antitoxin system HipA family toxin [Paludibacteraceae bacterium]|nr:type II toxin-antitoxin system HipA family toxin [Paludibacteraceae bacterium]